MTNPDFAELKEKLILKFLKCDHSAAYYDVYAAIITELIEIIQSQSEALTDIDSWLKRMSDLHWHNPNYAPKFKKSVKNNSEILSETTTRLQKLREGK